MCTGERTIAGMSADDYDRLLEEGRLRDLEAGLTGEGEVHPDDVRLAEIILKRIAEGTVEVDIT